MDMDRVYPWIGLDWVTHFSHLVSWVGRVGFPQI